MYVRSRHFTSSCSAQTSIAQFDLIDNLNRETDTPHLFDVLEAAGKQHVQVLYIGTHCTKASSTLQLNCSARMPDVSKLP